MPGVVLVLVLGFVLGLALAATEASAQVGTDPAPTGRDEAKILKKLERCVTRRAFVFEVDFGDWSERLESHRGDLAAAQTTGEYALALNRALGTYGVSHLVVIDPTLASSRRDGRERGAGFKTIVSPQGDRVVSLIQPDGPALALGLQKGDVIFEVDGEALNGAALVDGVFSPGGRLMPGKAETRRLAWRRGPDVMRAEIGFAEHPSALPSTLEWRDGDVAWMTINSFRNSYVPTQIESFFAEIKRRGARALVLDLRGNGGGRTEYTRHLSTHLMRAGTVVGRIITGDDDLAPGAALETAGTPDIVPIGGESRRFDGPVVVLVDSSSGSGGDYVPGFLQQVRGATLIGRRTAGDLLGGTYCELGRGFRLLYPFTEIVLPDGTRIEGVGVEPDIELTPVETVDDLLIESVALNALPAARKTTAQ